MVHQQHQGNHSETHSTSDKVPSLHRWKGQEYRDEKELADTIDDLYWPITSWLITFSNLLFVGFALWNSGGSYDWAKHGAAMAVFCLSLGFVAFTHHNFLRRDREDVRRNY